jgi:hypothetical protein
MFTDLGRPFFCRTVYKSKHKPGRRQNKNSCFFVAASNGVSWQSVGGGCISAEVRTKPFRQGAMAQFHLAVLACDLDNGPFFMLCSVYVLFSSKR